jgi:hypothetical protein
VYIILKDTVMGFIDVFNFRKYISRESDQTLARVGHVNALKRYVDDVIDLITNGTNGLKGNANYFDFSSSSVTAFSGADTWTKLVTNTNSLFADQGWVLGNNRLTWNSAEPIRIKMEGIASVSSSNGQEIHFAFFRSTNGNPPQLYPCSEQSGLIPPAGANKSQAVPFHCVIELQPGDYIEAWVKNSTSGASVTLLNINVIVSNW